MRKSAATKHHVVVAFDIETEPFCDEFEEAKSDDLRLQYCPKIRIIGVYNSDTRDYLFYMPDQCKELIAYLLTADRVVTFNGKKFDLLVLQKHGGLRDVDLRKIQKKHLDLLEIAQLETGRRYSLDRMVKINFDERKKVSGRKMCELDFYSLREANRSDVRQTFELYRRWENKTLMYPAPRTQSYRKRDEEFLGVHSQLPPGLYLDLDTEDMTDGQMAEYLSGTWGITVSGEFIEM